MVPSQELFLNLCSDLLANRSSAKGTLMKNGKRGHSMLCLYVKGLSLEEVNVVENSYQDAIKDAEEASRGLWMNDFSWNGHWHGGKLEELWMFGNNPENGMCHNGIGKLFERHVVKGCYETNYKDVEHVEHFAYVLFFGDEK